VARAVIELSGDISPALPLISRLVKGCGYNPKAHLAAFNLKGTPVIIEANEITIYGTEDEAAARKVMEWLKEILNSADKTQKYEVS
jgi:ArsR family metal-binding transcriptional regulator